ncbi:MAG: HNH endonuclease [Candidatus Levybacteria bacterium]|nr:HNH endonuclease [Candidatus Levybacteria bacterium]
MQKIQDDILSYREMCDAENATLQRGMNYRLNPKYSVILMSQRNNAPYQDRIYDDGITIEYEGHDVNRKGYLHNPKDYDQIAKLPSGTLTQNGKFVQAVINFKDHKRKAELVKVYEKIIDGVWSLKGIFELVDFKVVNDEKRNVYRFILKLTNITSFDNEKLTQIEISHTRIIPSEVKKEVWKRDSGKCVVCGESSNLHFDHELPFSKGGTSLTAKNVQLLCMKHNLQKSAKIE